MNFSKSYFIIVVTLFSYYSFSQSNKPEWIDDFEYEKKMYPADSFFYFKDFIDCSNESIYKSREENLKEQLIRGLAGKIQTSVKSETQNNFSQLKIDNNSSFSSSQSKKSQLSVNVSILPYESPIFWPKNYLKTEKKIHGIIAVKKYNYLNVVKSHVEITLKTLEINLQSSPKHIKNNDLVELVNTSEDIVEGINNNIILIRFIDNKFDVNPFYEKIKVIKTKLDEYRSAMSNKEFEDSYIRAKTYLDENNCLKAYNEFKILFRLNSSDKRVIEDKNNALQCLNNKLLQQFAQKISKNNFVKAIEIVDSLILLNPNEIDLYSQKRTEAIESYFVQTFNLIEIYSESNLAEAKRVLDGIQVFGTSKYNTQIEDSRAKINSLFYKNRVLEFKYALNQKDFSKANQTIILIGKENSSMDEITSKLSSLGKKLNNATYSFEKKNLLKSRPNRFCIQVGASLTNQFMSKDYYYIENDISNFKNVVKPTFNTLFPSYSISLYKKIKIKELFSANYRDKSRSNLIGLKFSYLDLNNPVSIEKDSLLNIFKPCNFNLQLSTLILRSFNFNYGINTNSIINLDKSKTLFTTSFGLKIPIWNFRIDLNVNYLSDYRNFHLLTAESSLLYNLNFGKKFSKEDKDMVQLKSQKWRY